MILAKKKSKYFNEKCTYFQITHKLKDKDKWTLKELKDRHNTLLTSKISKIIIQNSAGRKNIKKVYYNPNFTTFLNVK